ncbi:potassium voltage-gated channel subfamily KQT member 1 isoform B [Elysia marginata]|uniref:Potassium voltage-gated channel subfamily KQT member 1 isoform B n=1 Tax=Elysia marginata TaxID=1093978 RepID=A0AAV4I6T7_9GAST|nr:potassium voltage-gated channel subfamily KQT member 1 isoform B [Elysia marginata]
MEMSMLQTNSNNNNDNHNNNTNSNNNNYSNNNNRRNTGEYDADSTNEEEDESDVNVCVGADITSSLLQPRDPSCGLDPPPYSCVTTPLSTGLAHQAMKPTSEPDTPESTHPLLASDRTDGTPPSQAANRLNQKCPSYKDQERSDCKISFPSLGKADKASPSPEANTVVSLADGDGGQKSQANWPLKKIASEQFQTPSPSDGPCSERTNVAGSYSSIGGILSRRDGLGRQKPGERTVEGARGSDETDQEEVPDLKLALASSGNPRGFDDNIRIRIKKPANTSLQVKVYNFLERPTGWKCFIYHFTV